MIIVVISEQTNEHQIASFFRHTRFYSSVCCAKQEYILQLCVYFVLAYVWCDIEQSVVNNIYFFNKRTRVSCLYKRAENEGKAICVGFILLFEMELRLHEGEKAWHLNTIIEHHILKAFNYKMKVDFFKIFLRKAFRNSIQRLNYKIMI